MTEDPLVIGVKNPALSFVAPSAIDKQADLTKLSDESMQGKPRKSASCLSAIGWRVRQAYFLP